MPVSGKFSVESRLVAVEDWLSGMTVTNSVTGDRGYLAPGQMQPWHSVFGNPVQSGQTGRPGRSNLAYIGVGNMTDGAAVATGVMSCTAVPVEVGDVITTITYFAGATAGGTMTHQFAALYSGTNVAAPPRIAQSTDTTSAAIVASTAFPYTLSAPVTITAAMAPNGFIYAALGITATTVPTAVGGFFVTAAEYQYISTGSPILLGGSSGSAVAGTAPATLASLTFKAAIPLVLLT